MVAIEAMDARSLLLLGALASARLLPVVFLVPYMGGRFVPGAARVGIVLALAVVAVPAAIAGPDPAVLGALELGVLLTKEVLVGLAIGFLGALVFYAVQMGGALIDTARGETLATSILPGLPDRANPTTALFLLLTIVVYLTLNGHHLLIRALARSFELIPVMELPRLGDGVDAAVWNVVRLTGELFGLALVIALPVAAAVLLVDLAMGVASRAVPHLHGFFLGLPVKALLGLLATLAALSVIASLLAGEVGQSVGWIERLVEGLAG